jgi:hypothetical protein
VGEVLKEIGNFQSCEAPAFFLPQKIKYAYTKIQPKAPTTKCTVKEKTFLDDQKASITAAIINMMVLPVINGIAIFPACLIEAILLSPFVTKILYPNTNPA